MNLTQLEALVAIIETGSFTQAAERIGLTRSALSHALANFEGELGIALIERKRGGTVAPTTAGNCILPNAREILASIENIRQEAAMARGLQAGKLRIGLVTSITVAVWGKILRKFRQEYPNIEIVTFEGTGREVADWILSSIVDVGFVLGAMDGIETINLGHDEVKLLIPTTQSLRYQQPLTLEGLANETFILPKRACDFLGEPWHVDVNNHYEVTEVQTILAMVLEGLGISLLPEMLLPSHTEGLQMLSLDPRMCFTYGLGVRSMRNASPAAQMFIHSARSWAAMNGFEEVLQYN